jgi:hypothetical protein
MESARKERPDEDLGSGDGKLKVKLPSGGELLIQTTAQTKVRQIRRIVGNKLESSDFELCVPLKKVPLDDNSELGAIGLYPRGVLMLRFGVNSGPIKK